MSSTFSTNLAIELIGTGDQAGSWGNTTNTNLGTLIEQAISGYVTQAVATGTDTTITIPNGSTGVARNMYLELTGTGGTNTNLIVPANKKLYFVYNNTTGAVTVKVSGQTGVSVAVGEKKILVSNGTDIVEGTTYLQSTGGSITVTTLTATSGTITNLNSTSAQITTLTGTTFGTTATTNLRGLSGNITTLTSTSANITTLSGTTATFTSATVTNLALTSLTLSNLSVSSANITTLTSSSATISTTLALSGGTANGVAYLNASKVLTTGSALQFSGTYLQTLNGTGIQMQNAGATANWFFETSGLNLSFTSAQNGAAIWSINGSEQMRLNSTGLGIGTSSPSYKLDVVGGQRINAVSGGYLDLSYNGTVAGNIVAGNALFYVNTQTTNTAINANGGNVGIGTSSPSQKLHVAGNSQVKPTTGTDAVWTRTSNDSGEFYLGTDNSAGSGFTGTAYARFIYSTGAYPIAFYTNSSQRMLLDSSGNLGIGTSSPAYNLEVSKSQDSVTNAAVTNASSGTGAQTRLRLNNGGSNFGAITHTGASFTTSGVFRADGTYVYGNGTGGLTLVTGATQPIYFGIANNEVARFDTSGNLGIGTTSPSTVGVSGYTRLVLGAGGSATDGLTIVPSGTGGVQFTDAANVKKGYLQWDSSTGALAFGTAATERMRIDSSGNLLVGTTSGIENGIAIFAGAKTFTSGIPQYQLQAQDTTAMAAGVGGAINFTGKYTSGGAITSFASIEGSKDNATSGNFGAGMVFKTRVNGGSQTEAMRIDSSQNVGIGTSSPSQKLNVATASGNAYMRVERASQTTGQVGLQIGGGTSSTDWLMYIPTSSNTLTWFGNSTNLMSLDTSGNLGLGVTPSAWGAGRSAIETGALGYLASSGSQINVLQNSYFNGTNFIYKTTAAAALYQQSSGVHAWYNAPSGTAGNAITFTQAMTLDASGNLLVGKTSGTVGRIQIAGDHTTNGSDISLQNTNASGRTWRIGDGVGGYPGSLVFFDQTSVAARMLLDSSGNLLVGTTSSFSSSKLTVQGNATYAAAMLGTAGNTTSNALFIGLGGNRSTDTTYSVINYVDTDGAGTARFRVYGNGNVVNTNNSYGAISDAKLKENVIDATPKLDNLCKVRIVNYNLIGDETKEKRIGVIAQELEQVFPSLVDESADLDEEGNPTGTTTKAVKYSVFVPMLIKAMQEQQAMIEELKARIVTLENK